jgi:hypothetical protein
VKKSSAAPQRPSPMCFFPQLGLGRCGAADDFFTAPMSCDLEQIYRGPQPPQLDNTSGAVEDQNIEPLGK